MEGGLFLIFIIIAMAARAIEALTKGRQGGGAPQDQPQQRRPRQSYELPHGTTRRPVEPPHDVSADSTSDAAAEMIPDDLWQILTGQPKPQRRVPPPQPQYEYDEAGADEELELVDTYTDEVAEYDVRRRAEEAARVREARELETRRARGRLANTADKAPVVVSLERPLPSPEKRHAAFHRKIDKPLVVETVVPTRSAREWLFQDDDLKRAMVLQEVLGTPKGLE